MAMTGRFFDPMINYFVDDVEAALQFYTGHFGFVETYRIPREGRPDHVEVRLGPLLLGLSSKEAGRRDHGLPLGPHGNLRVELVLWTDAVDEVYARLAAHGVPGAGAPHDFLDGALRTARVFDPDGNPVNIVQKRTG